MNRAADSRWSGLHVLADDASGARHGPLAIARAACDGGASVVQLRAKRATDREAIACGREIRTLTRRADALFVVNDRFDLALAVDADGVHLGQTDLSPARVPDDVRARLAIGRSTHGIDELDAANAEPIEYVAFGPVFETGSKAGAHSARGLDALADAAKRAAPRPLVAIGGIDAERAPAVRATGAAGFAVIGAVANAADPTEAVRSLVRAWSASA